MSVVMSPSATPSSSMSRPKSMPQRTSHGEAITVTVDPTTENQVSARYLRYGSARAVSRR